MLELLRGLLAHPRVMADGIGDGVRLQQTYANQYQQLDRTATKATTALQGATTTEQRQEALLQLRDTLATDSVRDAGYLKSAIDEAAALIEQGTPEALDKASKWLLGVVADQKKALNEKVEALRDPAKAKELAAKESYYLKDGQDELKGAMDKARAFIRDNAGRLDAPDVQRQIRKNAEEINTLKSWIAEKGLDASEATQVSKASRIDPEGQKMREMLQAIGIDDLDVARGLKAAQKKFDLPETGKLDRTTYERMMGELLMAGREDQFKMLHDVAVHEDWARPNEVKADKKGATINGFEGIQYKLSTTPGRECADLNGTKYQLYKDPPMVDPNPGKPRPMTTNEAKELMHHLSHLGEQLARVVGDPATPAQEKAAAEKALEQLGKVRKAVPPGLFVEL